MNDASTKQVVIIGGGITGLAATHKLLELNPNLNLTLLEAGARLGGVIRSTERDGFLIEEGADSFISEKPEALNLSRRLGLDSHLIETNPGHRRSFIVRDGRLLPVPEGFQLLAPTRFWPFVTTDIFSWSGKARMALDLILPARQYQNGSDDECLAGFVRRRLGREAFERMAQPMIGGIYTADPEKLSLRATLPRFLDMERDHRSIIRAMWHQRRKHAPATGVSGPRYSLFLSFDGGMQTLVDGLCSRVQKHIRTNAPVKSLTYDAAQKQWLIGLNDETVVRADLVCLAVPAYVASSLTIDVDSELSALLSRISYASTAIVNVAYNRADIPHTLDGFGFVVPAIERRSILACSFSSVKFAGRAPADKVLLRVFIGGALQSEVFELEEPELMRRVFNDLADLLGVTKPPFFSLVSKWRRAMPQYHVGHLQLVRQIRTRASALAGLALAGNSYEGTGVPDCIRSGENAALELLGMGGV